MEKKKKTPSQKGKSPSLSHEREYSITFRWKNGRNENE